MHCTEDEILAAAETLDRLRDAFRGKGGDIPDYESVEAALRVISSVLGFPADPPFLADGTVTQAMASAWGVLADKARQRLQDIDQSKVDREELEAATAQVHEAATASASPPITLLRRRF